jgi:hypothetical protein
MTDIIHFSCSCGQPLTAVIRPAAPKQLSPIVLYQRCPGDAKIGNVFKFAPGRRLADVLCPNPNCRKDFSKVTAEYLKEHLQDGGKG